MRNDPPDPMTRTKFGPAERLLEPCHQSLTRWLDLLDADVESATIEVVLCHVIPITDPINGNGP